MPRSAIPTDGDLEAKLRDMQNQIDQLRRSVPGAAGGGSVATPFTIGSTTFDDSSADNSVDTVALPFVSHEFDGVASHGVLRPRFVDFGALDAWRGERGQGQLAYVEETDAEYIWNANGYWSLFRYPVITASLVFVPTSFKQVGTLAVSTQRSAYRFAGSEMGVEGAYTISSGTGTAGNRIEIVTGLPFASGSSDIPIGVFRYLDSGTKLYEGVVYQIASSPMTICFQTNNTVAFLGQDPSFPAGVNDTIQFNLRYFTA